MDETALREREVSYFLFSERERCARGTADWRVSVKSKRKTAVVCTRNRERENLGELLNNERREFALSMTVVKSE